MKPLLATIVSLLFYIAANSTAQLPDKIFFEGKEYELYSNPLESYFNSYPDKKPKSHLISTGLWRGYIATFEIRDSQLFVIDIQLETWDSTDKKITGVKLKSVMAEVFPGQKAVKVDWLTGLLVLPYGELVGYVHMGYGSTYEHYFLLEVNKGNYIKSKQFDNKDFEKFKDRQFAAFKKTPEYQETKPKLKRDNMPNEFLDSFLRNFVTEYTSKIYTD
jgi:hypothetical protein